LIRSLLVFAMLLDFSAPPAAAQSASRIFEGAWTMSDASACAAEHYVIVEQAETLVFRDQDGKVNVEAIVERRSNEISTQTTQSGQVQNGTRWDYQRAEPSIIVVRNRSTGHNFNLAHCLGYDTVVPAAFENNRAASLAFMQRYMATWSSDNQTALAFIANHYVSDVLFYGKSTPRGTIMQQKEAFVRRWPIRSYVIVPGSVSTNCVSDACEITATVEWTNRSIERGADSSGVATFTLRLVGQGTGTMITTENGSVMARELRRSAANPPPSATWPQPPTLQPERPAPPAIPQIDIPPPRP